MKILKNNGLIDFDDMLTICYEILSTIKNILNIYRNCFEYIQLDEAQDTSTVQFAITDLLGKPKDNVFYLADDDQSIYSFRASSPEYLLSFKNNYPNGTIYFMEQNFRSTSHIISLSNTFIKSNENRYSKDMFTNKDEGRPVTMVTAQDEKAELEHIIKSIQESNRYDDNAVLYRNNLLSIPLVDELYKTIFLFISENKIIDFYSLGTTRYASFIKLAINENDLESFERIKYKSNLYLNKNQFFKFYSIPFRGYKIINALLKIEGLEDYQRENIADLKFNLNI